MEKLPPKCIAHVDETRGTPTGGQAQHADRIGFAMQPLGGIRVLDLGHRLGDDTDPRRLRSLRRPPGEVAGGLEVAVVRIGCPRGAELTEHERYG